MWIDGPQEVMANERTFPRLLPWPGRYFSITVGERIDVEKVFGPFRRRWRELVSKAEQNRLPSTDSTPSSADARTQLGEIHDHELRHGHGAEQLHKDLTLAVRYEVLKVRRSTGLPDEDPKCSLVETWWEEGNWEKKEGKMRDGSVVRDI
jgi:monolysocardiolipin acyltransferase